MSTEPKVKDADQNALASRLSNFWTNFKQGKLISYKTMAILLLVVAGLGLWWYLARESRKAVSQQWMDFDDAFTATKLEELAKKNPGDPVARVAEVAQLRPLLGQQGLDRLNPTTTSAERQKAVENIEKARVGYGKLLEKCKNDSAFKNDLGLKAECLWALGRAEQGLVGETVTQAAPTGPGPVAPTDQRRGDVNKAIEYFDQLAALAGENPRVTIPWVEEAKKRAETMRKDPEKFRRISRSVAEPFVTGDTTGSPVPPPPKPPAP
jgi:hypothetical protein